MGVLGIILIVILVFLLLGAFHPGPRGRYGYAPGGILGFLLIVLIILLILGYL